MALALFLRRIRARFLGRQSMGGRVQVRPTPLRRAPSRVTLHRQIAGLTPRSALPPVRRPPTSSELGVTKDAGQAGELAHTHRDAFARGKPDVAYAPDPDSERDERALALERGELDAQLLIVTPGNREQALAVCRRHPKCARLYGDRALVSITGRPPSEKGLHDGSSPGEPARAERHPWSFRPAEQPPGLTALDPADLAELERIGQRLSRGGQGQKERASG